MQDVIDEPAPKKEKGTSVKGIQDILSSERGIRLLYLVFGAAAIAFIFRYLQYSTPSICCGDFDGYYHITWSSLIWEGIKSGHFPPAFTWLPLTTLDAKGYVDHHLLFHILQIPFTWFFDLPRAAKISAMLFGSLAVFSCYWLIVRYRISYTLVWLLALLACSAPFLYRLNMAKAPPLAIIFMVAGIYFLFERKYWPLGPLMFLFVWSYSLFPTLLLAAVIWAGVLAWSEGVIEWRPIAWTGGAMVAGFLINPYFPKNIMLFLEHVAIKVTPGEFSASVGQEWYPYDSWVLVGNCLIAFIAMFVGYLAFNGIERKRSARALFFLAFSTVLMLATFRSRRFVEYWPPFAVLFAAFSLQPHFEGARRLLFGGLPEDFMDDIQPYLDREGQAVPDESERRRDLIKTGVASGIALVLFWMVMVNVRGSKLFDVKGAAQDIAASDGPNRYKGGMDWVRANVPPGERIFNTDWDDFPKLFFYDRSHSYITGLDPTYLLDKNPELSQLYKSITLGNEKDPGPLIRDRFGARFVFSDKEQIHDDFYANAMQSGWFDLAYEDDDSVVLRLRDAKGEPPAEMSDQGAPGDETDNANDDGGDMPPDDDAQP